VPKIKIWGHGNLVKEVDLDKLLLAFARRQFEDTQKMMVVYQIGGVDALQEMASQQDGVLCRTILHVSTETAEIVMAELRLRTQQGKDMVQRCLPNGLRVKDSLVDMRVILEDCKDREGWRHVGIACVFVEEEVHPKIPNGV